MKRWSYLFMAMGIAMAFSACSDEIDLSANNEESTEESTSQVFMQFSLELPAVSRSSTTSDDDDDDYVSSDAGVEIGKDYENQVSEVLVVITDATDDKFITGSTVTNLIPTGSNTTYVVPFNTNKLVNYVEKPVNIYVYCNPTSELKKGLESEDGIDVNATYTLTSATDETIWSITDGDNNTKNGHFLMTNADDDYERTLPTNLDNYKVESNPFDLKTIKVERAAARFDYKSSANTYTLMEDENGNPEVTVTLTDMALVNLSKEFYYLRRVSADGTSTSATIGGTETNTNYVVDTDYDWKSGSTITDYSGHFFYVYNQNSASADYTWTSISSLTNNDDDNNNSWNTDGTKGDYKIWRYATENTIPKGTDDGLQKKGITTGVAFKGEIKGVSKRMQTLLNGTNTVYVFDNILWGTWDNVKTAAEAKESDDNTTLSNPLLAAAYKEATKDGYTDDAAVAAGFTIFKPNANKKYEVLYYYWNRHNDNKNNGSMGPMEFAVVRNNVYKLSVTEVHKFGHPTNPGDDPDPENPEDPDEEDDVYFKVAVEVLPWVVRINDIEF